MEKSTENNENYNWASMLQLLNIIPQSSTEIQLESLQPGDPVLG